MYFATDYDDYYYGYEDDYYYGYDDDDYYDGEYEMQARDEGKGGMKGGKGGFDEDESGVMYKNGNQTVSVKWSDSANALATASIAMAISVTLF